MENEKEALKARLLELRPGATIGNAGIETLKNRIAEAEAEDGQKGTNGPGANTKTTNSPASTEGAGATPTGSGDEGSGIKPEENQSPGPENTLVTGDTLKGYPEGAGVIVGDHTAVADYKVQQFELNQEKQRQLSEKMDNERKNNALNKHILHEKRTISHGENYVVAVHNKTELETVFSAKAWSRLSPKDKDGWKRKVETPDEAL